MFRLFLVSIIAAFILIAATVAAQAPKDVGDIYTATTDPGNTNVTAGAPWTAYPGGTIEVPPGTQIWIGVENREVPEAKKRLTLTLTGWDLDELTYVGVTGYDAQGNSGTIAATQSGGGAITHERAVYQFLFVPQPEWEVIEFSATEDGTVSIDDIVVVSSCNVPSLTHWGLLVLVLLVLASAVYVIYRRRKTVTA
ncbi:MAG: hypothetical protein JSU69_05795 [Candidatus Zixiibacteriota bacterium]|nr:MAG: hypothetical protein JSU69_05795 [candidate division Zixibacteria bacterium]